MTYLKIRKTRDDQFPVVFAALIAAIMKVRMPSHNLYDKRAWTYDLSCKRVKDLDL